MKKQNNVIELKRECPECKKDLFYKTVGNLNWANKHDRKCKPCSFKGKVGLYERTEEIKKKISEGWEKGGRTEEQNRLLSEKLKLNPPNKPKFTKEEIIIRNKESRKKTNQNPSYKEKENNRTKKRYSEDINFKIRKLYSNRLYIALKKEFKKGKTIELLGCSIEEFKVYLEKQFDKNMSWENHGTIWEIDHIKPCASFDLMNPNQQKECFHYTNLQPLFKTTEIAESFGYTNQIGNRNKSNKL
jgi:hypothetical protein